MVRGSAWQEAIRGRSGLETTHLQTQILSSPSERFLPPQSMQKDTSAEAESESAYQRCVCCLESLGPLGSTI